LSVNCLTVVAVVNLSVNAPCTLELFGSAVEKSRVDHSVVAVRYLRARSHKPATIPVKIMANRHAAEEPDGTMW